MLLQFLVRLYTDLHLSAHRITHLFVDLCWVVNLKIPTDKTKFKVSFTASCWPHSRGPVFKLPLASLATISIFNSVNQSRAMGHNSFPAQWPASSGLFEVLPLQILSFDFIHLKISKFTLTLSLSTNVVT